MVFVPLVVASLASIKRNVADKKKLASKKKFASNNNFVFIGKTRRNHDDFQQKIRRSLEGIQLMSMENMTKSGRFSSEFLCNMEKYEDI